MAQRKRKGEPLASEPKRLRADCEASWETRLRQLKAFVAREGRLPKAAECEEGFKIGRWCATQRLKKTNGELTAERIEMLRTVSGWKWEFRGKWSDYLERLRTYVAREGRLPRECDKDGDWAIGNWCSHQRRCLKDDQTSEKALALASVPGWWWTTDKAWTERATRLREFVVRKGRMPTEKEVEGGWSIGRWYSKQRQRFKDPSVHAARTATLSAIPGWEWGAQAEVTWENGLKRLREFVAREGRVPRYADRDGDFSIGTWCFSQRHNWVEGVMSPERGAALMTVPGWWWVREERWQARLEQLSDFVARTGRLPVRNERDGWNIGHWCKNQRERRDGLSAAQQAALAAVPGWHW